MLGAEGEGFTIAMYSLDKGRVSVATGSGSSRADNGELRPEQVSLGKLNTVCETIAIARECRTLLGAARITLGYPIMRHANNRSCGTPTT